MVGLGQIREVGSADWVDNLLLEKYIWQMVDISSEFLSWGTLKTILSRIQGSFL